MHHLTTQRLLAFTDHVEFERMVLDILSHLEFPGIDPQSPTVADGGKDGLYYYADQTCAWFAFSLQKGWKTKYDKDLKKALASGKEIKRFIFCTNRDTAALERDARKNTATQNHRIDVDFWDGERLRVALDTICKDIRQTYLGIADNSTIRRKLRYILLDPENEVDGVALWRLEAMLPLMRAPRGVFDLLKGVDLSTVCETNIEIKSFAELLEAYFAFRMFKTQLETYGINFVGEKLKDNTFLAYWQIIAEYCIHVAFGASESDALRWSQLQGVSHDGAKCKTIYPEITKENEFQKLLVKTKESADKCATALEATKNIKSLLVQLSYNI